MRDSIWKQMLKRRDNPLSWVVAGILWPISLCYRFGTWIDRVRPRTRVRVNIPVISVGNISVGGSGKTPLVALLASELISTGLKVGVVSSGYGRKSLESFVEPGRTLVSHEADEVGDEVRLLALKLPDALFAVDSVKAAAAQKLAEHGGVDLIIVDDGFQHYKLHRDLDIVTFDASTSGTLLAPLPYGILREPMSSLSRSDIVIITRANLAHNLEALTSKIRTYAPSAEIFKSEFRSERIIGKDSEHSVSYLEGKSVFLFAGVASFNSLERQVRSLCGTMAGALELSDHQRYDSATVERLRRIIAGCRPDVVLTTEKDWVKVRSFDFGGEFYYLDPSVKLDPGAEQLTALVKKRLTQDRRRI
jgi:tetraacyldisaccharide 4'-kinase